ncbi:hypothetical protein SARC_05863 [Sphaeroforma arctica JP610]|uniref:t-SNARE coiled-coil homology domain-containing protein n=1 Tax=Sphaeroforma arctica JP610 TaxID=667725 RepID=A0A0L0FZ24_9EUKA|nr:hypothetical protein SARC_05863 [Sphaeroforma arctica JP610]KNC81826.1 hypothetical protein SARC_05863 [Sphaeroforma arctica JP610]|eukprot:XP_014155728.1 hypothetical protein SARC_05863 [Sphaeroforma arctica JP610]
MCLCLCLCLVPDLPGRLNFGKSIQTLAEERCKPLETYLKVLLLENDQSVISNPHISAFLDLRDRLKTNINRSDTWSGECEDLLNLANEIAANITSRNTYRTQHKKDDPELVRNLRGKLSNISTKSRSLARVLEGAASELTEAELIRRQNSLDLLRSRIVELERLERAEGDEVEDNRAQRSEVPDRNRNTPRGRVWGKETEATKGKTTHEVVDLQRDVMAAQDAGLDRLAEVVQRQKHVASAIGNELDEQNRLLEDLDGRVERTHGQLANTTKRVMKLL